MMDPTADVAGRVLRWPRRQDDRQGVRQSRASATGGGRQNQPAYAYL
jgi:hypothetical protein